MLRKVIIAGAWAVSMSTFAAAAAGAEENEASARPAAPQEIAPLDDDHAAAAVTQVALLEAEHGAKLYSIAEGDTAINGQLTYIASFGAPPEGGWRVFQIGDFNSWSVAEDRGDEVVLAVNRSWVDESGAVQSVDERLIVSVPGPADPRVTVSAFA